MYHKFKMLQFCERFKCNALARQSRGLGDIPKLRQNLGREKMNILHGESASIQHVWRSVE